MPVIEIRPTGSKELDAVRDHLELVLGHRPSPTAAIHWLIRRAWRQLNRGNWTQQTLAVEVEEDQVQTPAFTMEGGSK